VDRREFIAAAGSVTAVASASQASEWLMRGAVLDHAVPGVGLTVSGPVREVRLYFTIGMIAASSRVQIKSSTGASIAASRPVNDCSSQDIVIVRLKRALPPGTHKVSWLRKRQDRLASLRLSVSPIELQYKACPDILAGYV
jgi:methionine-rich copper-binding protein CopC